MIKPATCEISARKISANLIGYFPESGPIQLPGIRGYTSDDHFGSVLDRKLLDIIVVQQFRCQDQQNMKQCYKTRPIDLPWIHGINVHHAADSYP